MVLLVSSHQQNPWTWSLPCLYEQNILRAKCGGVNSPNSASEISEPTIMVHTRCRQLLLLMIDFETLNKEEEQVKKDEPVKPKSSSKPRRVWQKKVAPPLEAPLLEAPPQESSSSRMNWGTQSMNFARRSLVRRT